MSNLEFLEFFTELLQQVIVLLVLLLLMVVQFLSTPDLQLNECLMMLSPHSLVTRHLLIHLVLLLMLFNLTGYNGGGSKGCKVIGS